jgi:phenylacetic acid degradation operon negative regulatory protein
MGPTAKSLILDLLTTLRGGSMPVRALVAAGALFGIGENNIRVSLARLLSAEVVVRDDRGSYRLGERAEPVRGRVASWRRVNERMAHWQGSWVGLQPGALPRGSAARRPVERARRFLGFRELRPGLELRPDNLVGGVEAVREQLEGLGLEPGALVFGVRDLDSKTDAAARSLWDVETLAEAYQAMNLALERSRRRLPELSAKQAMVESFLVGGEALRSIALDPLLPEAIAASAPRESLVTAMDSYDHQGRICWAAFMADFGLPHLRAPLDLRIATDAALRPSRSTTNQSTA